MTTSPTRAMAGPATFEHHREALGIGEARPRLSWTTATSPVNSADPEWVKVKAASEVDGKIVAKAESVFMNATDYSPIK